MKVEKSSGSDEQSDHDTLHQRWVEHSRQFTLYCEIKTSLEEQMTECCDRVRAHWRAADLAVFDALKAKLDALSPPPFPEELRDYTCGARTRAGTPCRQRAVFSNGRCKFHGGLSTGPITEAGKAQARENGKLGGRPPRRH